MRRKLYGEVNYAERHADIAGVDHRWVKPRFYPSEDEIAWAWRTREATFGERPVVFVSLSGSSVHKAYPFMDNVMARLLTETDAGFVLAGDHFCRILEAGWEKESRVLCTSGQWTRRKSMTFAAVASDVVFGPETGILNAVGCDPAIAKVIMLSHSSATNLTKHWQKVIHLTADVPCRPCHRIHHNRQFCPQTRIEIPGEERPMLAAACCAYIPIDAVVDAIRKGLRMARVTRRAA